MCICKVPVQTLLPFPWSYVIDNQISSPALLLHGSVPGCLMIHGGAVNVLEWRRRA